MKNAFKILFSILAVGLMSAPIARAQDDKAPPAEGRKGGKGGGGRAAMFSPEERIAQIEKAVGTLTDDQKAKIKDIMAKQREEMQSMRGKGGGGGDREAARAKMQEMQKANRDQIRAVLTPEQQKKFDEMPADGGRRGGKGGKKKDQ
jgi:Spy/CpxP family protein refolding chaperone